MHPVTRKEEFFRYKISTSKNYFTLYLHEIFLSVTIFHFVHHCCNRFSRNDACNEEEEERRRRMKRAVARGRERQREVAGGETDAPALLVMLAVAGLPVCDRRGRRTSQPSSTICSLLSPRIVLTLACAVSFFTAGFNPAPGCPSSSETPLLQHHHHHHQLSPSVLPAYTQPSFSRPLFFPVSSTLTGGPLGGLSQTWRLCPVLEAEGDDSPPRLVFLQPAAKLS